MTETQAIVDLAGRAIAPVGQHQPVASGELVTTVTPEGWALHVLDTEAKGDAPRRSRGTVQVHDAASFIAQVARRAGDESYSDVVVYADEETTSLVAVLNDDRADAAGWRDYRVQLLLRRRPEWVHWTDGSGKFFDQEAFAEHVEEGLPELVRPSAADMLDLAQTFHAQTSGRFKQSGKLSSGAVQFVYEEDIDASAGVGGTLAIPETIELGVAPFFGSDRFAVTARFRYRLRAGELTLGYVLDRPLEVERAAFTTVRDSVSEGLGLSTIAGPVPAAVTAPALRG